MSLNEHQLETEIDRQLKALPELTAPEGLVNRVMATIEAQERLPWFRRSWQTWPSPWQGLSMVSLIILFTGLCYAGWELSHFAAAAMGKRFAAEFLSLATVWNALNAALDAVILAFHQLGNGYLIGICAALALGYAIFLGLGTLCVRLGFSERDLSHL